MGYTEKELASVTDTLNLEYGANRRYGLQMEKLDQPRLLGLLEGVRRNEGDHIEIALKILRENVSKEKVDGWATTLMFLRQDLAFEEIAAATYGRYAKEAEDPELKKVFLELARAEYGHINLFKTLIAEIEDGKFPFTNLCELCGWEMDWGVNPRSGQTLRCPKCGAEFKLTVENDDFKVIRIK
jgi:rubrerythrin